MGKVVDKKKEWLSDRAGKIILGISIGILLWLWLFFGFLVYISFSSRSYIPSVPSVTCLDVASSVDLGDRTCYDNKTKEIRLQITRRAIDFEWADITIIIEDKLRDGYGFYLIKDNLYNLRLNDLPEPNGARTFKINFTTEFPEDLIVSIAPVIVSAGKRNECWISSTKKLEVCAQ